MDSNTTTLKDVSRRQALTQLGQSALAIGMSSVSGMAFAGAHLPIIIQFSHVVSADTPKGRAALRFKELAESRTGGQVRVEVYPNSTLYKDREELDALRLGAVQMLAPSLSKLSGLGGPDFDVFDLPFLFKDRAAFQSLVTSPLGDALLRKLETSGVKGLAYWDNGFKIFTANRPLHTVADFQGLKVRTQASRVLVAEMNALGAHATVFPMSNVYDALRSGQIDGEENTPINITSQHLNALQSHVTVTNHGYLAYAVIVNKLFWDKLPARIRSVLEGALRDATLYETNMAESENNKALEQLKTDGNLTVYTPTPQEISQLRAALQPVYREARKGISPQTLTAAGIPKGSPP